MSQKKETTIKTQTTKSSPSQTKDAGRVQLGAAALRFKDSGRVRLGAAALRFKDSGRVRLGAAALRF